MNIKLYTLVLRVVFHRRMPVKMRQWAMRKLNRLVMRAAERRIKAALERVVK